MTFILPSFGASAISAVPGGGGGGGASFSNGYALSFDGTDDALTLGSAVSFTGEFTVSAWVKPNQSGLGIPVGQYSAGNFVVRYSNSQFSFWANGSDKVYAGGSYSNNSWYHLFIVRDSSDLITFYINGSSDGSFTKSGTLTTSGLVSSTFRYKGLSDEYAMWDSDQSSNLSAIYNSGVPTDLTSYSPVGWWRMGDNDGGTGTTITDQGSGGNDGTLTNGPTYSTDVPVAPLSNTYSLDFDGTDDYLDLSSAASLLNSQSVVTMSFWYYADNYGLVAGARASNTDAFAFWPYDASNFYWIGRNGGGGTVTASNPGLNQWVHCVGVQNGTSATLYLTPTSTGTTATTTGTLDGTLSATLGNSFRVASDASTNSYFNGKVDEVAVWNSALSASDVTTLYNSGVPGDISSLNPVGWWRMGDNDSGTGTTITDQGSGGNDGTLVNGPTFSTSVPT